MQPEFDATDAGILDRRERLFNQRFGPRVGDFLRTADGFLRFTYDCGDGIQTTCKPNGGGSFYLGEGYADFSGGLDSPIKKADLRDSGETREGMFWFFHHDRPQAHNGVDFKIACRVFERIE